MPSLSFQQVDVFTDTPFKGNPVAVVLEADILTTEEMQRIAHWTNLSETTFVCKSDHPEADYKLRIFTPYSELPFAGHPTLGSAQAVLNAGLQPKTSGRFVQESKIGLINIDVTEDTIFFTLPKADISMLDSYNITDLASALGITKSDIKHHRVIDIGAVWYTLNLKNAAVVNTLLPDMQKLSALIPEGVTGVTVFGETNEGVSQFEVRSFAPNEGVPEDPVCGSGNGCVAHLIRLLDLYDGSHYTASQGAAVGREGHINVRFKDNGDIKLGGRAVSVITGSINI